MRKRSGRSHFLLPAGKACRLSALARVERCPEGAIAPDALAVCLGRRTASGSVGEALADLAVLHLKETIAQTRRARQRLERTLQQLGR